MSTPAAEKRQCAVCQAPSRSTCGACHAVWYCGSEHQKQDWKHGGHKRLCAGGSKKSAAAPASSSSVGATEGSLDQDDEEKSDGSQGDEEEEEEGGMDSLSRNKVLVVGATQVGKSRVIQDLLATTNEQTTPDGRPVAEVCSQTPNSSHLTLRELRWWPYPVQTKYYTATLDLWEVPHERVLAEAVAMEQNRVLGELLEGCQALVLVFDLQRPESFAALEPWGEALLRLQELGGDAVPEVCLCVGNSVSGSGQGGVAWKRAVADANDWCIDHGLELVTLAHGSKSAQHPVECRTLLHDLDTSVHGTARLAEALQCNMWRALKLAPAPGRGSGGGGQSGLLAGFLGGSSDRYGGSDPEAESGGDDDWVDDRDDSVPPTGAADANGVRITVMQDNEDSVYQSFGRVQAATHYSGDRVVEDEEDDPELAAFFAERAAEADRWFEETGPGNFSTERLGTFDPAEYQELPSDGDEDHPEQQQQPQQVGDEDRNLGDAEESTVDGHDGESGGGDDDGGFGAAAVQRMINGAARDENEDDEFASFQEAAASLEQEELEADNWEQLVQRVQQVKSSSARVPDAVRRQNAEQALFALLKVWDKMDLDD